MPTHFQDQILTTVKRLILTFISAFLLSACSMYGAGYPRPEYSYVGAADDPEFFLDSDFGVSTQFTAKTSISDEDDPCGQGRRVAYLQAMDSYYRDPDAKGPWKISAPANQPIVITGQWTRYGTQVYEPATRTTRLYLPSSCPVVAKKLTPVKGGRYRIHLRNAGALRCDMDVATLDGSSIAVQDVPTCANPRR